MTGSAREEARSATEKPDDEDDKVEDADAAKDGRRSRVIGQIKILEMNGSAREAARSATEKPDYEDNKDEDADAAKDGRRSKMAELLGPFFSRGEKVGTGGSCKLVDLS